MSQRSAAMVIAARGEAAASARLLISSSCSGCCSQPHTVVAITAGFCTQDKKARQGDAGMSTRSVIHGDGRGKQCARPRA
eukprot:6205538-Pleurochrysis_carterae.AAC.2